MSLELAETRHRRRDVFAWWRRSPDAASEIVANHQDHGQKLLTDLVPWDVLGDLSFSMESPVAASRTAWEFRNSEIGLEARAVRQIAPHLILSRRRDALKL